MVLVTIIDGIPWLNGLHVIIVWIAMNGFRILSIEHNAHTTLHIVNKCVLWKIVYENNQKLGALFSYYLISILPRNACYLLAKFYWNVFRSFGVKW